MRAIAVTITLILALLGVILGALRYMDYTENPRSSFASFAEMEAAGMVASGWLPEFLPKSATHIEESHNKVCFAKSIPIVVTFMMTPPVPLIEMNRLQSGTLMPLGAGGVHIIR